MVFGKLYVSGGIDPTYLALEPLTTDPIPAGLHGIWIDNTPEKALRVKNNYITLNTGPNETNASVSGIISTYTSGLVENKEDISVIKIKRDVKLEVIFLRKPTKDQIEKLEKTYIKKQIQPLNNPSKVPEETPKKINPEFTIPL